MPGVSVHTIPGRRGTAHVRQCGRQRQSVAITTSGNGSVMHTQQHIPGAKIHMVCIKGNESR
jgi:hypothetical protein